MTIVTKNHNYARNNGLHYLNVVSRSPFYLYFILHLKYITWPIHNATYTVVLNKVQTGPNPPIRLWYA